MRALIAFYTRTGITRKAAEAIAAALTSIGHEAVLEEIVDR